MCFADVHVEVFCSCVFQVLQDLQVTVVIHLGDLCSSSLLQALVHSSCKVSVHVRAFEARTTTCTSRETSTPTCASTDVRAHAHGLCIYRCQGTPTCTSRFDRFSQKQHHRACTMSRPMPSVRACFGACHFESAAQAPQNKMSSTLRTSPCFSSSFGEAPALRWLQGLATITLPSVPLHVPTQLILHDLFLQEHQVEVPACC